MSEDFMRAVEDGLRLSKRIYFGKDRSVAPPKQPPPMTKSPKSYLPTAPMVYAVVSDPSIVDNPDIPSYQPYVYGRCDPPALVPLQMNRVEMEVDCVLDTAFVRVTGSWRVHCVMGSKSCDCRIAVPMGEQGSILGVEVDIPRKSFHTQLVSTESKDFDKEKDSTANNGGYLKPGLFTVTIPQVDGGVNLSINISWVQKLTYDNEEFSVNVPFCFPEYVTPAGKKMPKKEKIHLSIKSEEGIELLRKSPSHPVKELRRQPGVFSFLYESDVISWSSSDFSFSYTVPSCHMVGNVLLQSPSIDDKDQREIFCIHMLPGSQKNKKVFPRKVVYVVDISSSMQGKPLKDTKDALTAALSLLSQEDSFNIIAFNGGTFCFSPTLKLGTEEEIGNAKQWIDKTFVAADGTNIFLALSQALEMFSDDRDSLPMVYLITDGSVDNERQICDMAKSNLLTWKSVSPRIHTFGIGLFCNHYFLQMLATIGRGYYDAAYDADLIECKLTGLFSRTASISFANIIIDIVDELDMVEMHPAHVPDLSACPLTISGRYKGNFPEVLKARGTSADMKSMEIDLKVKRSKELPLDRVVAMQEIRYYTAQAWFLGDKNIEEKVARMSMETGIASEYTRMILVETETWKKDAQPVEKKEGKGNKVKEYPKLQKTSVLQPLGVGFGNLRLTDENLPPGTEEARLPEAAEIIAKAASDCCTKFCGYCCCMCFIQACSKINNQCAIVLTQACTAFACFGCLECCTEICCGGQDG